MRRVQDLELTPVIIALTPLALLVAVLLRAMI